MGYQMLAFVAGLNKFNKFEGVAANSAGGGNRLGLWDRPARLARAQAPAAGPSPILSQNRAGNHPMPFERGLR